MAQANYTLDQTLELLRELAPAYMKVRNIKKKIRKKKIIKFKIKIIKSQNIKLK